MRKNIPPNDQSIVAAPSFCLGVCCDDSELSCIDYLKPCPELAPSNALAAEAARQLRSCLHRPDFIFGLPLRPSGTTFQRRVWAQISLIPNPRTYGEVAKALHNAPRAVGQACGANPFPVLVSCRGDRRRAGWFRPANRWFLAQCEALVAGA
jgi:methylated-DNA-[protein]-cysteine S-methyltransferase